jgi:hypothetical protein
MKGTRGLVADTWDMLDRPTKGSHLHARALADYEAPHGPVLLAWDSDGTRRVLVPIGIDEEVHPDHSSQGVQLARTELVDAGVQRAFVDIRCPKPSLFRVFDQITSNMLEEVTRSTLPASRVCRAVLAEWRQLLLRAQQSISTSVLRGAFAELQELLRLTQLDANAIQWWTGPHAAPQDFVSPRGAIEVKAIGSSTAKAVGIHGLEQLHAKRHDFLVLVVWPTPSDPNGANLADLVQRLEQAGADSDVVRDKLALLGIHNLDVPDVRNARFGTGPETGYLVGPDFPRLSPTQLAAPLHPAVQQVGYELALDQIPDDPLSQDQLGTYRRRLLEPR